MTSTYYIIKASNLTLRETYLLLHMKVHFSTREEANKVLKEADPDIIPPGSQICRVEENATDFDWPTVNISIKITTLNEPNNSL